MKLYAVTFGCFRCTVVASEPERAVDEALYGTKPWYIDETELSTSIPPELGRQWCYVNEVEQRPYIKSVRTEEPKSIAAEAASLLGVDTFALTTALAIAIAKANEIRTSAPASQEATNNPISKGEHKE